MTSSGLRCVLVLCCAWCLDARPTISGKDLVMEDLLPLSGNKTLRRGEREVEGSGDVPINPLRMGMMERMEERMEDRKEERMEERSREEVEGSGEGPKTAALGVDEIDELFTREEGLGGVLPGAESTTERVGRENNEENSLSVLGGVTMRGLEESEGSGGVPFVEEDQEAIEDVTGQTKDASKEDVVLLPKGEESNETIAIEGEMRTETTESPVSVIDTLVEEETTETEETKEAEVGTTEGKIIADTDEEETEAEETTTEESRISDVELVTEVEDTTQPAETSKEILMLPEEATTEERTMTPEETTTELDETTIEAATELDETATVLDETMTESEESTTIMGEIGTQPEETTTEPDEITEMLEETTQELEETTVMVPEETTTEVEETTLELVETTPAIDETTTELEETTTEAPEVIIPELETSSTTEGTSSTTEETSSTTEETKTMSEETSSTTEETKTMSEETESTTEETQSTPGLLLVPETDEETTETPPENIFDLETTSTDAGAVLVPMNTNLLESVQAPVDETTVLAGTEPKRIGAYIVVGLILLSFLSLVGYIALKKRIGSRRKAIDNSQDNKDTEKALLSMSEYKDHPDAEENNIKNNEITPIVIKQNSQINKFEKNTNFSSPKNLNTTANEKNIEKDNVLKEKENLTQAIIEEPKEVEEEKLLQNTEKLIVRTHVDPDSIPRKAIIVNRMSGGYSPQGDS